MYQTSKYIKIQNFCTINGMYTSCKEAHDEGAVRTKAVITSDYKAGKASVGPTTWIIVLAPCDYGVITSRGAFLKADIMLMAHCKTVVTPVR